MFGFAYADAVNDLERERIVQAYVPYMQDMVTFYEEQALAIVGEDIPQVLLVHAYALNAAALGELFRWLRDRGYQFVGLEEALDHPAFQGRDQYDGPAGITPGSTGGRSRRTCPERHSPVSPERPIGYNATDPRGSPFKG